MARETWKVGQPARFKVFVFRRYGITEIDSTACPATHDSLLRRGGKKNIIIIIPLLSFLLLITFLSYKITVQKDFYTVVKVQCDSKPCKASFINLCSLTILRLFKETSTLVLLFCHAWHLKLPRIYFCMKCFLLLSMCLLWFLPALGT